MGVERIPVRLLAPASLVLFAVVFLIVVVASLGGGDSGGGTSTAPSRAQQSRDERPRRGAISANRRVYVVRSGDTLAGIAERTDVPVDRLISLNPEVDPQGLVTGQRIKLRE